MPRGLATHDHLPSFERLDPPTHFIIFVPQRMASSTATSISARHLSENFPMEQASVTTNARGLIFGTTVTTHAPPERER